MKKILNFIKKNIFIFLIILVIILLGLYKFIFLESDTKALESNEITQTNALYDQFVKVHPNVKILKWKYEDISDDNEKDLIVIYKDGNLVRMSGYVSQDEDFILIEELAAPVENQTIKLKNIDDKGVVEFIVSGSKDGLYGYSIFRFENNQFINLFAEGMEDCCN